MTQPDEPGSAIERCVERAGHRPDCAALDGPAEDPSACYCGYTAARADLRALRDVAGAAHWVREWWHAATESYRGSISEEGRMAFDDLDAALARLRERGA